MLIRNLSIALVVLIASTTGARLARAQGYSETPVGGTYYNPAATYGTVAQPWVTASYGYTAYPSAIIASSYYPSAGSTPTAESSASLESRIRELESRLQGGGSSSGAVIQFIEERGW